MRLDENNKMYKIINNIHLSKCDKTHQHNKVQILDTFNRWTKHVLTFKYYVDKYL